MADDPRLPPGFSSAEPEGPQLPPGFEAAEPNALREIALSPQGLNRGLDNIVNLFNAPRHIPRAINWATGSHLPVAPPFDLAERFNPGGEYAQDVAHAIGEESIPQEPQTGVGRFATNVMDAIGAGVVPEAAVLSRADKLRALAALTESQLTRTVTNPAARRTAEEAAEIPKGTNMPTDASRVGGQYVGPTTPLRQLGAQVGTFYAEHPGAATAWGAAGNAVAGGIGDIAQEAELPAGWQIFASSMAPGAAASSAAISAKILRGLYLLPEDAFTVSFARWNAKNATPIWRRLGYEMSADGSGPAPSFAETPGGQAAAFQVLANELNRAGVPPYKLEQLLMRMADARRFWTSGLAPDRMALVDMDPTLQAFAGYMMRHYPDVWRAGVNFMYARQTGLMPARGDFDPVAAGIPVKERMAPDFTGAEAEERFGTDFGTPDKNKVALGQRGAAGEAFRRMLLINDAEYHQHMPTADMTDLQLEQMAGQRAKPWYDRARAAAKGTQAVLDDAGNPTGQMQDFDMRPTVNPIAQRWLAASEGDPGPVQRAIRRQVNDLLRVIEPTEVIDPTMPPRLRNSTPFERFDNWKRFLDADIRRALNSTEPTQNTIGNFLLQLKNEVLGGAINPVTGARELPGVDQIEHNGLGALYSRARSEFNGPQSARRALELGDKIAQGKAGLEEYRTLDGDKASQKLVRLGMYGRFMKDTAEMSPTHDVTKWFDKPRMMDVISEISPRRGQFTPERLGRYLDIEGPGMMYGTAKRTYQGSPTAERGVYDQDAAQMFDLAEKLKGGKWDIIKNSVIDKLAPYFGYRKDTAATLARILFTAEPNQRLAAIQEIQRAMTEPQFQQFVALVRGQARRAIESSIVTGADQQNQP